MINFIFSVINLFLCIFKSKKILICENALLKKEIEILKRKTSGKRIFTCHFDRLFIIILNSIAERFIGSVRREALDYFIIINKDQVKNILKEYIHYYNSRRPHKGIDQHIPNACVPQKRGKILKMPILSGLHHHYFREAA